MHGSEDAAAAEAHADSAAADRARIQPPQMNVRTASILVAALPALLSAQAPQRRPTVWIGPPGVEKGKALRALFEHPEEWKQTRTLVDGLLTTGNHLNQFSDDELRLWFGRLHEWKLRLMLEVGAVKEWARRAM